MRAWAIVIGVIAALLVIVLGALVANDAGMESLGACEDLERSVCDPEASCPDGFTLEPLYTCTPEGWICCVEE